MLTSAYHQLLKQTVNDTNAVTQPQVTKTRKTFKEAYDDVIANFQIKQVANGTLATTEWMTAVNNDIATAHKFLDDFVADLNILLKPKNRVVTRVTNITLSTTLWVNCTDIKQRAARLYDMLCSAFNDALHMMLRNIGARVSTINTPLARVGVDERISNVCTFTWPDPQRTATHIQIIDWCYKSPDDFTRNIPSSVKHTRQLLERTTFDYKPAILDGTLIDAQKQITTLQQDPALVLRLGIKDYDLVVDYWKEPHVNDAPWSLASYYVAAMLVLVIGLISCSVKSWLPFTHTGVLNVCYFIACLVVALCGCLFAGLVLTIYKVKTFKHPL